MSDEGDFGDLVCLRKRVPERSVFDFAEGVFIFPDLVMTEALEIVSTVDVEPVRKPYGSSLSRTRILPELSTMWSPNGSSDLSSAPSNR